VEQQMTIFENQKRLSTPCFDMPSEIKCSVKKVTSKLQQSTSIKENNNGEGSAWRETFRPTEENMTFRPKADSTGKKWT
jgi:hypothetical protein